MMLKAKSETEILGRQAPLAEHGQSEHGYEWGTHSSGQLALRGKGK